MTVFHIFRTQSSNLWLWYGSSISSATFFDILSKLQNLDFNDFKDLYIEKMDFDFGMNAYKIVIKSRIDHKMTAKDNHES